MQVTFQILRTMPKIRVDEEEVSDSAEPIDDPCLAYSKRFAGFCVRRVGRNGNIERRA